MMDQVKRFVVGMDGSDHAAEALRWAVAEAEMHGVEVEAVLVWSYLDQHHPDHSDRFDANYGEAAARTTLSAWITEVLGSAAGITHRVVLDLPVHALLEVGDVADLIVLGARGTGGFEGLLFGSVSERVAQLANRPVAIVREAAPVRGGRVVVGVDGSARALGALRWAAAEALARDADLDVVHAWRLPMMAIPPVHAVIPDFSALEDSGRAVLECAVADPGVAGAKVHAHLTNQSPARALLDRADGAGVLVVGTRGHGRVTGSLLGSVSRQLLHHATCPVVVV
jgi:nucleotide-binding universal stress UspA family protein